MDFGGGESVGKGMGLWKFSFENSKLWGQFSKFAKTETFVVRHERYMYRYMYKAWTSIHLTGPIWPLYKKVRKRETDICCNSKKQSEEGEKIRVCDQFHQTPWVQFNSVLYLR